MQGTMPSAQAKKTMHRLDGKHGQDSPSKSQSEWQRTEINGEGTFMVRPTLRLEWLKNRTELIC